MARARLSPRGAWALVAVLVTFIVLFLVRPIFHGLAMVLWTAPLVWLPPLLIVAVGLGVVSALGRGDPLEALVVVPRRWRARGRAPLRNSPAVVAVLAVAAVAFLLGAIANGPLTARSLYSSTAYEQIGGLPAGGTVRLVPKDVAQQIASSGLNSPTETLTDFHIVRTPEGLSWTALRTPDGFVRTLTKKTQGVLSLDAEQTSRNTRSNDAEFETAPGLQITDNLRWRLLKRRYFIQIAEMTAIVAPGGRPLIIAPYIEFKGLLVRRPVFGGVFVVHPDGRIEDLEPEEAARRPELAGSGRLYPEALARRVQDAYAYKRGIWNRFFVHEEQTQISDTEVNRQPYLIDFGARGSKWVTVAEPYGRAFAVNSVFLTDTLTGRTQIWRVPPGQSLTGNRRAVQTVRSVSIPGVVFADDDVRTRSGGRFRVVEPRPVFVSGKLVYLLSIVPESANSVSKSVIVDAASNKVVQIFDNDRDPEADAKTLRFLATGRAPGDAAPAADEPAGADPPATAGNPGAGGGDASPADVRRRLDELIARQRRLLRDSQSLRDALP